MDRSKRICLVSIVHYYLVIYANKSKEEYVTRKQLAGRAKIADRDLNAFINKGADQGVDNLYKYFEGLIYGEEGKPPDPVFTAEDLPEHIRVAMRNAYGNGDAKPNSVFEEPARLAPGEDEFNLNQVRDKDPEILSMISSAYAGMWRVIRYSAHASPGEEPRRDKQGTVVDGWTVLATVGIFKAAPERAYQDLRFEIHYQPREDSKEVHLTSKGSVLSVGRGQHLFFLGGEDRGYPICIIASRRGARPTRFRGLVLRKHEAGPIFATRAMFVRADVEKLDDLDGEIGTRYESALKTDLMSRVQDIDQILEQVNNLVPNEGKHCLKLLESGADEAEHRAALEAARRAASANPVRPAKRNSRTRRKRRLGAVGRSTAPRRKSRRRTSPTRRARRRRQRVVS